MQAGPILETVLYADDLIAARRFYEGVLGLDVDKAIDGRFVFFRNGPQMLLIFNPAATRTQDSIQGPPPHGARGPGHVCFRATRDEIGRWQSHLEKHEIAVERILDWPDGGRSLYVRDPAGNSVEFAEPRIWGLPEDRRSLRGCKMIIATHNFGKLREIAELVAPHHVEAISAGDLGLPEPEETGTTFAANAMLKAEAAMRASGQVALADDSGLCVDALGGDPGIYSARWAGPDKDFTQAMRNVEEKLQAAGAREPAARKAHFVAVLSLAWPDGLTEAYEGRVNGTLIWPPRGTKGFGYDPMFVPEGATMTFGEMEPEAKNTLTHRARAFAKLKAARLV
jgi:XTP/dITP diphosphohydrolase